MKSSEVQKTSRYQRVSVKTHCTLLEFKKIVVIAGFVQVLENLAISRTGKSWKKATLP